MHRNKCAFPPKQTVAAGGGVDAEAPLFRLVYGFIRGDCSHSNDTERRMD